MCRLRALKNTTPLRSSALPVFGQDSLENFTWLSRLPLAATHPKGSPFLTNPSLRDPHAALNPSPRDPQAALNPFHGEYGHTVGASSQPQNPPNVSYVCCLIWLLSPAAWSWPQVVSISYKREKGSKLASGAKNALQR